MRFLKEEKGFFYINRLVKLKRKKTFYLNLILHFSVILRCLGIIFSDNQYNYRGLFFCDNFLDKCIFIL